MKHQSVMAITALAPRLLKALRAEMRGGGRSAGGALRFADPRRGRLLLAEELAARLVLRVTMTPEQFRHWRRFKGYSLLGAAEALDISSGAVQSYEAGARREGRRVIIPRTVELACAALALGIERYAGPKQTRQATRFRVRADRRAHRGIEARHAFLLCVGDPRSLQRYERCRALRRPPQWRPRHALASSVGNLPCRTEDRGAARSLARGPLWGRGRHRSRGVTPLRRFTEAAANCDNLATLIVDLRYVVRSKVDVQLRIANCWCAR